MYAFSVPGDNRQLSIYNSLRDLGKMHDEKIIHMDENSTVLIHDAARPLLSEDMIASCYQALEAYDGVMPVLPMKDTVYLSEDGETICSLLNREQVFAGQAPELFLFQKYREANERLIISGRTITEKDITISKESMIYRINGSSEPAVMAGLRIKMIQGWERNLKITTQSDLERFEEMMR